MQPERRRHFRYKKLRNGFAVYGRKFSRVGMINDIGIGGMSFEYISGKEMVQAASKIDIFLTENDFHIYELSCKLIYDVIVYVPRVSSQFSDLLIGRRCGLRFRSLIGSNRLKLVSFLESKKLQAE